MYYYQTYFDDPVWVISGDLCVAKLSCSRKNFMDIRSLASLAVTGSVSRDASLSVDERGGGGRSLNCEQFQGFEW